MFRSLLCLFLAVASDVVVAQDSPYAVLNRAESFVVERGSYRVRARVTVFAPGRQPSEHDYQISHNDQDATLVEFLDSDDRGKSMLLLGDALWLRLPNLSRPIQISAAQRMSGDASGLDLVRTRFERDYNLIVRSATTVDGEPCYLLDLRAKHDGVVYDHVDLIVRRKSGLPVRADFYLPSGKPSKTLEYDRFDKRRTGKQMLAGLTILDHLKAGSRTTIEYLNFQAVSLPGSLFQLKNSQRPE